MSGTMVYSEVSRLVEDEDETMQTRDKILYLESIIFPFIRPKRKEDDGDIGGKPDKGPPRKEDLKELG